MGEPREFLQGGLELIGTAAPDGEAEVLALTLEALDAAGLRRHRIGVGDGSLYRTLLTSLGVPDDRHLPLLEALSRRDLVGLEMRVAQIEGLGAKDRNLLVRLPELRGGRRGARASRRPGGRRGRRAALALRAARAARAWPTG